MTKRHKIIFIFIFYCFVIFIPKLSYSLTTTLSHEGEVIVIDWPDSEGWVVGYEQDAENQAIIETVKTPETVENWTEIGTVFMFKDVIGTDLNNYIQKVAEISKMRAQRSELVIVTNGIEGEYDSRIFVIKAQNYRDGTSETQVQLILQGNKALYNIQRTKRTADLDNETINNWINFLRTVRIKEE